MNKASARPQQPPPVAALLVERSVTFASSVSAVRRGPTKAKFSVEDLCLALASTHGAGERERAMASTIGVRMSTGTGNTIVLLLSPAMEESV
jgi:hypothetical protein